MDVPENAEKKRPYQSKVAEVSVEYAVATLAWSIAIGFVGLAAKAWQWVLFP